MPDLDSATVLISGYSGMNHFNATGVLLSPDLVLTAAHVAWDSPNGVTGTVSTSLLVSPDNQSQAIYGAPLRSAYGVHTGTVVAYEHITTDPYWSLHSPHDFALIRLDVPVSGAAWMTPASDYAGQVISAQGYPYTSRGYLAEWSTLLTGPFSFPDYGFAATLGTNSVGGASGSPAHIGPWLYALYVGDNGLGSQGGIYADLAPGAVQLVEGWMTDAGEAPFVARLYYGILDRRPDPVGLAGWSLAYRQGSDDIVSGFLSSAEFTAEHGNLAPDGLVALLYAQALGRAPEPGAVDAWADLAGRQGIETMVLGITQSPEAVHHSALWGIA